MDGKFSLHAQRCFPSPVPEEICISRFLCMRRDVSRGSHGTRNPHSVFSAYAEMFLLWKPLDLCLFSFLCMRRDVSFGDCQAVKVKSFLCMRRDVSETELKVREDKKFSLRAQRCFLHNHTWFILDSVFSACAETFSYKKENSNGGCSYTLNRITPLPQS